MCQYRKKSLTFAEEMNNNNQQFIEMKKILTLLAFVLTCQLTFSQTYNDVINQFKESGEYMELTKDILKLAADSGQMPLEQSVLKRIDCFKILQVTDAAKVEELINKVKGFDVRYNKLGEEESDGEKVLMYYDGEDTENMKAIIVCVASGEGCQFVVMEGSLSSKDLDEFNKIK